MLTYLTIRVSNLVSKNNIFFENKYGCLPYKHKKLKLKYNK